MKKEDIYHARIVSITRKRAARLKKRTYALKEIKRIILQKRSELPEESFLEMCNVYEGIRWQKMLELCEKALEP